jgi:hypothetical protein
MTYKLKSRAISAELQNHSWIKDLREISSLEMLEKYIMLYIALFTVTLTEQED